MNQPASEPSVLAQPGNNPWLHRFAVATALATFVLLGAGGLVTSHGAGMAVPDWPNTYGYNLFLFPISQWIGGIFYEHTHRLIASVVGMLTAVLALWLYGTNARAFMRRAGFVLVAAGVAAAIFFPKRMADGAVCAIVGAALGGASYVWPRCVPSPKWLRRLGLLAFVAVVLQGILGGLRVVLFKDQIGVFHATLAQLFFALLCAMALFTSKWWTKPWASNPASAPFGPGARWVVFGTTTLILMQLIVGAAMRHQHAGLAIPDFPLAYGKLWPATDAASVEHYNEQRIEVMAAKPITAFQIELQMAHRLIAVGILAGVALCVWTTGRGNGGTRVRPDGVAMRLAWMWLALVLVQAGLGAMTILTNKAADVATAHVMVGALSLATGSILSILAARSPEVPAGVLHGPAFSRCEDQNRAQSNDGGLKPAAAGL